MASAANIQSRINGLYSQKKILVSRLNKVNGVIQMIDVHVPGYVNNANLYINEGANRLSDGVRGIKGVSSNLVGKMRSKKVSGISDVRRNLTDEAGRLNRAISNCDTQIAQNQRALVSAKAEEKRRAEEARQLREEKRKLS